MKKVVSINGMTCGNCQRHVAEALREVAGVKSAVVDLAKKNAVVESDTVVSDEALTKAVSEAGYAVTGIAEK